MLTRGSGRADDTEHGRVLRLADDPVHCTRRIGSGVVAAAGVELRRTSAPGGAGPAPGGLPGLIDGIPPEIMASRGPDAAALDTSPPPTPPPTPPPATPRSTPPTGPGPAPAPADVQHTVRRSAAAGPSAPAQAPSPLDHLQQGTQETVLAVHCGQGHVTPASTVSCRVCGSAVPPQEPQRVPRPRLGVLHLPDGEQVALDRGVVFGRQPSARPGGEDWPQLVRLPNDQTYVSRNHLHVELDGWLVLATDLGSRGGTTLRVAGRPPERIRAGERYIWEPGQVLDLADGYEILFTLT